MDTFFDNYKKFPKADCGFCGKPSCVSALRSFSSDEFSLEQCIYFQSGKYNEREFKPIQNVNSGWNLKPGITMLLPCAVDPNRKAVEIYLSYPENLKYGYFDMISADKILYIYVPGMGFCPSLGIGRFDRDTRAIWGYWSGQVLCRLALDEQDAFWQISRFTRWLWGAVN